MAQITVRNTALANGLVQLVAGDDVDDPCWTGTLADVNEASWEELLLPRGYKGVSAGFVTAVGVACCYLTLCPLDPIRLVCQW